MMRQRDREKERQREGETEKHKDSKTARQQDSKTERQRTLLAHLYAEVSIMYRYV